MPASFPFSRARALAATTIATALLISTACGDASPGSSGEAASDPPPVDSAPVSLVGTPETRPAPQGSGARREKAPPKDTSGPRLLADILRVIVTDNGLVRYDRFADPEIRSSVDRVVTWYDGAPLPEDREERLAFLCNAYNVNVLARTYRESIKPGFENVVKVPGFFDAKPIRVGGKTMTLNALENEHVRPLGDPRIHAVLVCAAVSCPPLRNEPYRAVDLDEQFDDQCQRWVNDSGKFKMVDGKLGLSEILKWYGDDFKHPPYGSPVGFVLAYARTDGPLARYIANSDPAATTWIPYDWSLNKD